MGKDTKILFTDLDGTLLNDKKEDSSPETSRRSMRLLPRDIRLSYVPDVLLQADFTLPRGWDLPGKAVM